MERLKVHISGYLEGFEKEGYVRIRDILSSHHDFEPFLHKMSKTDVIDVNAVVYAMFRLPKDIFLADRVCISTEGAKERLMSENVGTPRARRALWIKGKIPCIVARSWSDIHDLIGNLAILQVEWNKMHKLLRGSEITWENTKDVLGLDEESMLQLDMALYQESMYLLKEIKSREMDLRVDIEEVIRKKKGSDKVFAGLADEFAEQVGRSLKKLGLEKRKLVIASSNMHSIANLLSGYSMTVQDKLISFVHETRDDFLIGLMDRIEKKDPSVGSTKQDFFYYVSKKYIKEKKLHNERQKCEQNMGIFSFEDITGSNVNYQIMDLEKAEPDKVDKRIKNAVKRADARDQYALININYPFGMQARYLLNAMLGQFSNVELVMIMGKAGGFAGKIGDIVVPEIIFDDSEQESGELRVENLIKLKHFAKETFSEVFRKAAGLSSKGTVIINEPYLQHQKKNKMLFIEMEAAPFLHALRDNGFTKTGLAYYISDKPLDGNTLSKNLSFSGAHATYSTSAAVLNCIFEQMIKNG